jgi:membrane-associated phospholipid phosphatase
VGDLLPLIVTPMLYGEIPRLIAALGTSYHDSNVQRWEGLVFGGQPSHGLAGVLPMLPVSELLHAGYLAYYPMIFALPLLLFVRGERRGMAETVLALTATYTICWVIFVTVPVEGPRYLWPAPPGIPDGPARAFALRILAAGSARGAAFPSSHMAVATTLTVMAFRWQRRGAWISAAIAALIGFGAVYGGFHYALDMIAGAVLGGSVGAAVIAYSRNTLKRAGALSE